MHRYLPIQSDYADSHKSKQSQPYAATIAAAYAKELLFVVPPIELTGSYANDIRALPWNGSSKSAPRSRRSEWDLVEEGTVSYCCPICSTRN